MMKNRTPGLLARIHLWADFLLLNASFIAAYLIRTSLWSDSSEQRYLNMLLMSNLIWLLCSNVFEIYRFNRISYSINKQSIELLKVCVAHGALVLAFLYMSKQGEHYSRKQFLFTYSFLIFSAILTRMLILRCIQLYRSAGYNTKTYATIGSTKSQLSGLIDRFYHDHKELGYKKCGTFQVAGQQGELVQLESFLDTAKPDYIYCCLSDMDDQLVKGVIDLARRSKTQVRLVPDFRGFVNNLASIEYHDIYPIIQINTKPFSEHESETLKRAFDLVFSCSVVVLGFPLFLLIMAVIALSSSGPVFFVQQRSGRWGNLFKVFKFRTMYKDADKFGMQHSQGDADPRITPAGRILRRTRLDELPQFFNVILGQMSVVGPRPLYSYDVEMLMQQAPEEFRTLLTVKPGITSIGQIKVGYASNEAENLQRLRYDLQYLAKYSLLTDVLLILQTIQVMILGRGR